MPQSQEFHTGEFKLNSTSKTSKKEVDHAVAILEPVIAEQERFAGRRAGCRRWPQNEKAHLKIRNSVPLSPLCSANVY